MMAFFCVLYFQNIFFVGAYRKIGGGSFQVLMCVFCYIFVFLDFISFFSLN